ncbi:hypothetical protein [Rhizohabitans arisaemae]|uniref:hypothetical protein n=1 Tax=Rhizohabitans arisaemae TaxID=2720610 RepID=UPI0024B20913|nr:hypothetical protein [Rhizohabitans arisaemae]
MLAFVAAAVFGLALLLDLLDAELGSAFSTLTLVTLGLLLLALHLGGVGTGLRGAGGRFRRR